MTASIRARLAERHPDWSLSGLQPLGAGLDFDVWQAELAGYGGIAIKAARAAVIADANDPGLDCAALLRQDAVLSRAARAGGLPTPEVLALHPDLLVMARVETDGSAPDPAEMAALLGRLHAVAPPDHACVAQLGPDLETSLAQLIRRRVAALGLAPPPEAPLATAARWPGARRALLHLDYRPANLLCRGGRIVAVIDWSNALIADPWLELARLDETGRHDPACAATVALLAAAVPRPPPAVERVYRLYTASMLANVFATMAPDPALARLYLDRTRSLLGDG